MLMFDTLYAPLASNGQDNRIFVSLPFSWSFLRADESGSFGQSVSRKSYKQIKANQNGRNYIHMYLSSIFESLFPSLSSGVQS